MVYNMVRFILKQRQKGGESSSSKSTRHAKKRRKIAVTKSQVADWKHLAEFMAIGDTDQYELTEEQKNELQGLYYKYHKLKDTLGPSSEAFLLVEKQIEKIKFPLGEFYEENDFRIQDVVDTYKGKSHSAKYGETLPGPMVLISSHGLYRVSEDFTPVHSFETPIKVFLYRQSQPSCSNFRSDYDDYRLFKILQLMWNEFTRKKIVDTLNASMCVKDPEVWSEERSTEEKRRLVKLNKTMYMDHCYQKVNTRVYEKGSTIANKKFMFELSEDTGGVRVVGENDYFTEESLLLPVEKGKNIFWMKDIIDAAAEKKMKEVHIIDLSCSSFVMFDGTVGKYVEEHMDHITDWEKRQLGGK
jgi:hypothetical protein